MMVPATLFFLSALSTRVYLWLILIPQLADKLSKHLEEESNGLP